MASRRPVPARLERPGAVLDLTVEGRGRTVVVAHGLFGSRSNEDTLRLGLAPASCRSIRYDARGHGRSTGRPEAADFAWPVLAEDLVAVVEAYAGGEPVDGIGASMGAATLLTAALVRPELFRRLVLAIPPTAWETRAAQAVAYRELADTVERRGPRVILAAMRVAASPPALAGRDRPAPDVPAALLPAVLRGAAASDLPAPEALRRLTMPTLLLPWAGDPTHPVETARRLLDLLPDAVLHEAGSPADLDARPALVAAHLGVGAGSA